MSDTNAQLDEFVSRLIAEKGLEGLDDDVLTQVREDLRSRLEDQINIAILGAMSEEDKTTFSALLDTGNEQEIRAFCAEHIENFDNLIATTLLRFREMYVHG